MIDSITAFFLCLVSVDVGGNCSCADYLTPLVCLLYFSLSLLCLNRRANTIHSLEIYCINTWRERWCRHPVSRSSLLSVNFIDNDTRRMGGNARKEKEKLRFSVHSIRCWQDTWALSILSFVHHSIPIVLTDWFLPNFTHLSYAKGKDERISRSIALTTIGQI